MQTINYLLRILRMFRYLYNETRLPVVAHNRYWFVSNVFTCTSVSVFAWSKNAKYFLNCAMSHHITAFHPSGVGKWVVIHVITWITGMGNIKLQTRAVYGGLVAGQSPLARSWTCTPALSVTQKRRCSCSMRLVALYKCQMPLPCLMVGVCIRTKARWCRLQKMLYIQNFMNALLFASRHNIHM